MHFYFLVHELKKWLVMLPVEVRGQLCGINSLLLLIRSPGIALRSPGLWGKHLPLLDVNPQFPLFQFCGQDDFTVLPWLNFILYTQYL